MGVRANADTPTDAKNARRFGAEGIGLCRTEHMFFDGNRIAAVREMIMADNVDGRRKALDKLLPMQRGDFDELFRIMAGLPVTIRLLDPPLHEFLPKPTPKWPRSRRRPARTWRRSHARAAACTRPIRCSAIAAAASRSPRGKSMRCRRARSSKRRRTSSKRPAQARARDHDPADRHQERIGSLEEAMIYRVAGEVMKAKGVTIDYLTGTMIELPRAALRDDAGSFLGDYLKQGLLDHDPFVFLE